MLIIDRYSWYMEASSRVKVRLPLLFVVPFFPFLFMSFFNDSREDQWFHKDATNRVNRSDSGKRIQYVFSTIIAPCCETSEKIAIRTIRIRRESREWKRKCELADKGKRKRKKEFAICRRGCFSIMFYKLAVNSVLHRIVYNDVHTFLNRFCPRSWTVFALDNRHFMDEHGSPRFSTVLSAPRKISRLNEGENKGERQRVWTRIPVWHRLDAR